MSHYDIDYSGLDPIARHNKAIQDIKDYMGEDRFKSLTQAFKDTYHDRLPSLDEFRLALALCGVQGYPVKAWYNHIWGL